jgi:hypothetical protein
MNKTARPVPADAQGAGLIALVRRLVCVNGSLLTADQVALRLAVTRAEAAAALGMSLDSFERHVQAEVRLIRRGRMRLVPVSELRRWLTENAERPMADALGV